MTWMRTVLLACFAALSAPVAALAQSATPPPTEQPAEDVSGLSDEQKADLDRALTYLNGIKTLKGKFRQIDGLGKEVTGEVWVQRPGKLRFEYDPPVPVLIVAQGSFLIHVDKELDTTTHVSQDSTPAWFLLAPKVELNEDIVITDVRSTDQTLSIVAIKTAAPEDGSLTISFRESPLRLDQWLVVDPAGQTTQILLEDVDIGGWIDPKVFEVDLPNPYQ